MIAFIKNYDLLMVRKKFILLYLLNVADITFTLLLLQTGYFQEVNFLMINAVESPLTSILIKVILPAILLLYLYHEVKDADSEQLRISNIAVNISLTIYAIVNLTHLVWVALLPFFIYFY